LHTTNKPIANHRVHYSRFLVAYYPQADPAMGWLVIRHHRKQPKNANRNAALSEGAGIGW
jgi:hypothetical protein